MLALHSDLTATPRIAQCSKCGVGEGTQVKVAGGECSKGGKHVFKFGKVRDRGSDQSQRVGSDAAHASPAHSGYTNLHMPPPLLSRAPRRREWQCTKCGEMEGGLEASAPKGKKKGPTKNEVRPRGELLLWWW